MRAFRHRSIGILWFNVWLLVSAFVVLGAEATHAWGDDVAANSVAASSEAPATTQVVIVDTTAAPAEPANGKIKVNPAGDGNAAQSGTGSKLSKAELDALATPTHHQAGVISINAESLPQRSVKCFCLTPDGHILAGCAGGAGEIRVFDETGKYVESWSEPFEAEAIYGRADGAIFIAGEGKLAKLSPTGQVETQHEAPHVAALTSDPEKIREEVINSAKQEAESFARQAKIYDQMIEQSDKQIAMVKEQIAALDQKASAAPANDDEQSDAKARSAARRSAANRQSLERRLAMQERMKEQYGQAKTQWAKMMEEKPATELTEDQIAERVKSSIQYKMQASSVSATDKEVILATHASAGYGFDVWRIDPQFESGERIITGLSGCCGQMDCKVNADGLYVAENSHHRVCHYDRSGKLISTFGFSGRTGIEGFGSCCNPMNVAFGPEGAIYTAEDDTGRIKRYSSDGKLLGLVGAVEVPPGCKNVSIAVNADGSRVYMLDITRNQIVQMKPYGPGESPGPMKFEDKNAPAVVEGDASLQSSNDSRGGTVSGILQILGIGN